VSLRLRRLTDADLDTLFEWERDPVAVQLAAFTRDDPSDRDAFDAHYRRVRGDESNTLLAVELDGCFVGTVSSFTVEGDREVSYWIDPARWGEGIATAALAALLAIETTRPLVARVAEHNVGSAKVLERAGFVRIGTETGYANGVGRHITDHIYQLVV
jgi:RimJ/RimL family protein N-acetyltransferase